MGCHKLCMMLGEVVEGYEKIMAIKKNILCPPAVYLMNACSLRKVIFKSLPLLRSKVKQTECLSSIKVLKKLTKNMNK